MTRQKSFKRLVRARMGRTGESYTAARAVLLAAQEEPAGSGKPVLATSDPEIRRRTGRGWEDWFDLLDAWQADQMTHRDLARKVAGELGIEPLAWAAQAVTYSYEHARGLRVVGQRGDRSFAATVSRTLAVPAERAFDAFADADERAAWLPGGPLSERTSIRPRSLRFDWDDGTTRVNVVIAAKGPARCTVHVEHARLADAADTGRMKAYWRERLGALRSRLEGGASDA
jgi:hypothetical protein